MGIRAGVPDAEPWVRKFLIKEEVRFRKSMSTKLEGHKIENGETVFDHLTPRVDAFLEGRAVVISRWELPYNHRLFPKFGGDPADKFVLGEDDVLRPAPDTTPKLKLNRKDRRRAGQRGHRFNGEPADGSD